MVLPELAHLLVPTPDPRPEAAAALLTVALESMAHLGAFGDHGGISHLLTLSFDPQVPGPGHSLAECSQGAVKIFHAAARAPSF